ncbi:hypothetical protein MW887_003663 [Aspergillus wentii]|nr:hypothetical protein MW887_003663 [Aspergillus wentii]
MIAAKVADPTRVSIIPSLTNHLWIRDTGPVYVSDGVSNTRYAINFHFNEWGNTQHETFPNWSDAQKEENHLFAKNVIESDLHPAPVTPIDSKICLEGGSLIVDGQGTLLATESSIINENRNPGLSKGEIEDELRHLLGVRKIIWFPGRKGLDVTDVHVDAEVQFASPGVVVVSRPHFEAEQGWKDVFAEIYEILSNETDSEGRPFEIHLIDEPHPSCLGDAEEKATNYVNFYCVNGGLILPMFGDEEADQKALHTIQSLCPDRVVKQVLVKALPASGGVVHCATQPVF